MNKGLLLLVFVYIFLIIRNYRGYIKNKTTFLLTIITAALSVFMLCSSNTADFDWSETQLDMSGYRTIYEKYDVLEHEDFNMYYLFYNSMYLGQYYGLSFRLWWTIMSILAMIVMFLSCKIHRYNFNLFLATFLAYYEIVFYSGFKFFYGFCFLLLAYGFLLRNNFTGKLLFTLFTFVAGGFHMMYYFFLVLLLSPILKSRFLMVLVMSSLFVFVALMRASDSALSFVQPFFDALDNEHINIYTQATVHFSFYISLFIHLVVVYVVYVIYRFLRKRGNVAMGKSLFYTVLLSLLFVPFYSVALTFMRLITAFSLVVICASSSILNESFKSRLLCARLSLLMVLSYYLTRILIGDFFEKAVVPYFDVL